MPIDKGGRSVYHRPARTIEGADAAAGQNVVVLGHQDPNKVGLQLGIDTNSWWDAQGLAIGRVGDPKAESDVATRKYVDDAIAASGTTVLRPESPAVDTSTLLALDTETKSFWDAGNRNIGFVNEPRTTDEGKSDAVPRGYMEKQIDDAKNIMRTYVMDQINAIPPPSPPVIPTQPAELEAETVSRLESEITALRTYVDEEIDKIPSPKESINLDTATSQMWDANKKIITGVLEPRSLPTGNSDAIPLSYFDVALKDNLGLAQTYTDSQIAALNIPPPTPTATASEGGLPFDAAQDLWNAGGKGLIGIKEPRLGLLGDYDAVPRIYVEKKLLPAERDEQNRLYDLDQYAFINTADPRAGDEGMMDVANRNYVDRKIQELTFSLVEDEGEDVWDAKSNVIANVGTPRSGVTGEYDVVYRKYVDDHTIAKTTNGNWDLNNARILRSLAPRTGDAGKTDVPNRNYVDEKIADSFKDRATVTFTTYDFGNRQLTNYKIGDPTSDDHAISKKWFQTNLPTFPEALLLNDPTPANTKGYYDADHRPIQNVDFGTDENNAASVKFVELQRAIMSIHLSSRGKVVPARSPYAILQYGRPYYHLPVKAQEIQVHYFTRKELYDIFINDGVRLEDWPLGQPIAKDSTIAFRPKNSEVHPVFECEILIMYEFSDLPAAKEIEELRSNIGIVQPAWLPPPDEELFLDDEEEVMDVSA